jgi:PAS domain S-box-containing protein
VLSILDSFVCLGFILHLALKYIVTQPLSKLTNLSALVAAGDLSRRIPDIPKDELGVLVQSFNRMTDALARNREEIEQINRQLEERVRERTGQLADQTARTAAIISSMADGLITFDSERRVTGMNAAAERLTGVPAAEATGKFCYEVVKSDACATRCLHFRARETGGSVTEEDSLLEVTGIPITFSSSLLVTDGVVRGGVETFRDNSPLKKLIAQVQRADRLSTVGTLAAGIAHELNNPIGNISTYSQLLLERDSPPPEFTHKCLTTIASETQRAGRIVRDLLDFSRQRPATRDAVDLAAVVEGAAKIALPAYSGRAAYDTVFQLPRELPTITGDAMQLTQVFINLITNALQAMPAGGRLTLGIEPAPVLRNERPHLAAQVRDTGTGIKPEHRARLFDPFFTTKEVGAGTGLGLSVSYGIVQEHAGTIEVESQEGHGTIFTVLLPVREEA